MELKRRLVSSIWKFLSCSAVRLLYELPKNLPYHLHTTNTILKVWNCRQSLLFSYFFQMSMILKSKQKKKQKTRRSLVELWYIMWLYTTYVLHRHPNITTTVNGQVFDWFLVLYLDFLRVHPFWRNFFLFFKLTIEPHRCSFKSWDHYFSVYLYIFPEYTNQSNKKYHLKFKKPESNKETNPPTFDQRMYWL